MPVPVPVLVAVVPEAVSRPPERVSLPALAGQSAGRRADEGMSEFDSAFPDVRRAEGEVGKRVIGERYAPRDWGTIAALPTPAPLWRPLLCGSSSSAMRRRLNC